MVLPVPKRNNPAGSGSKTPHTDYGYFGNFERVRTIDFCELFDQFQDALKFGSRTERVEIVEGGGIHRSRTGCNLRIRVPTRVPAEPKPEIQSNHYGPQKPGNKRDAARCLKLVAQHDVAIAALGCRYEADTMTTTTDNATGQHRRPPPSPELRASIRSDQTSRREEHIHVVAAVVLLRVAHVT
ncbi:unnamed protein product [Soboliphyme baturini]|uniref:Uncharacterized protein n=1 Tax=Soboliphyme baturini TaxID=241478 RepID=A0A183J5U5_9BILA|nr:unnamed protein product [Soboliphyme baturini]